MLAGKELFIPSLFFIDRRLPKKLVAGRREKSQRTAGQYNLRFFSFSSIVIRMQTADKLTFSGSLAPRITGAAERPSLMEFFLKEIILTMPKVEDLVEGKVIGVSRKKSALFVDLSPYGTGIICGKEFLNVRDTIKMLKAGDAIAAKVLELENKDGYIELSLKEAKQEVVWRELEDMQKNNTVVSLPVTDVNKGGLMMEWKGVVGFLPTSQLKAAHYPRVEDGDKERILEELKKFVGEKIAVTVIAVSQKENKLIFSEKGTKSEELKEMVAKYEVGSIVDGEITGVVDFGVFVKVEEGLEGLVHISELDWSLVENPSGLFKVGDKVKAQIISIADGKISLSIKALKTDPWGGIEGKYSKGDIVKGVIIKFNRHGALASIEEGVSGLVHISGFASEAAMREKLELGKTYPFQITTFEPKDHKLTLVYMDENEATNPVKEV